MYRPSSVARAWVRSSSAKRQPKPSCLEGQYHFWSGAKWVLGYVFAFLMRKRGLEHIMIDTSGTTAFFFNLQMTLHFHLLHTCLGGCLFPSSGQSWVSTSRDIFMMG